MSFNTPASATSNKLRKQKDTESLDTRKLVEYHKSSIFLSDYWKGYWCIYWFLYWYISKNSNLTEEQNTFKSENEKQPDDEVKINEEQKQNNKTLEINEESSQVLANNQLSNNNKNHNISIFALNAGKGNLIFVTRKNLITIVDCGKHMSNINLADAHFKEIFSPGKQVEVVFLTHSHKDHYNLLKELMKEYKSYFTNTKFYLGGSEEDWNDKFIKELKEDKRDKVYFKGRSYNTEELTFLYGVKFKLWGRDEPKRTGKINQNDNSLIITMKCSMGEDQNPLNVLFTGDANLDLYKRLHIDIPVLKDDVEHKQHFEKTLNIIKKTIQEGRKEKKQTNIIENCQKKLQEFFNKFNSNDGNAF